MGLKTVREARFFVSNKRSLFSNFATAYFLQIWPWHVNRWWNTDFGQKFMKSFHSGVICPPKPQTWRGSNRHLTQSRRLVKVCTADRYCLLRVVVQGQGVSEIRSTFSYNVRLRSYWPSKLPKFTYTKRLKTYLPVTSLQPRGSTSTSTFILLTSRSTIIVSMNKNRIWYQMGG